MQPNRAELALLRGKRDPQALTQWAHAFGQGDDKKAARLGLAIATFLGQPPPGDARNDDWSDYLGQLSPNTRKAYAAVLTEFFEWAAAVHKRVVSPEEITRLDAEEYVKWLANRPFSLAAEKLKDGDQEELRALYEIIEEQGTSSLQTIIDGLSPALKSKYFGSHPTTRLENRRLLSADVRKLVTMDVVQSTPTWAVLRQSYSQAGITQWHVPLGPGGRDIAVEDVFRYQPKQYHGASRTTVAQHISALSSFWKLLAQGENVKGGEPILQYNVWEGIGKRVSRGLAHEKRQASRGQKMPSDDVVRLLKEAPSKTLVQLRNKAILYLMVFAGVRTTEILMLRRGRPERGEGKAWFDGSEPPALQLVRKGGKRMRIPYPPVALKVLIEFQQMLERHAAPTFAQSSDARDEHYISRESVAWYYRDLQLADAPLFPPLLLWGANTRVDYRKPLSRVQCFRLLKQIGREVGMPEEQVAKIHPHALRHFAANAMVLGGKDIREVQAILGHSSITTTEGYLEDPEGDVKLSGQEAILNFLDVKGDAVKPTYTGPKVAPEREVIDVVAEAVEEEPEATSPVVTPEELAVLTSLKEEIPVHTLPESPPEYDPEVVVMAMPGEKPPIVETDEGLVGIDANLFSAEELQAELAASVRDGKSPGSPSWVYEAMADPNGTHETIVFNRGGQRDIDWLLEHYPVMPKNFGVGHESYLPWFVKARGNLSRGGFFKGLPPFPLFSPEQCNPETSLGEAFLTRIEQAYSLLVHGDPETGRAPSPLRSVGMVRWYSFFVYHSTKFEEAIAAAPEDAKMTWAPWNAVVDLGQVRAHDDAYLVQWLQDNAHTFRASIDAMKRGVSRTDDDVTASFLKSSFEGIELITEVPEWMIFDDPVAALYESDPKQWEEMILWLKNVTGQQLDTARIEDREEQEETALVAQKTKAKVVRDLLVGVVRLVDQLSRAKHLTRERVDELREHLRVQLYWYATAAANVSRLRVSLEQIKTLGTKEFNQTMSKEYERLGIPDPNAPEFRKLRGKKRVAAMVAKLFPDIPELSNGNVFAESKLFDPKWFRIDEKKHTVFIEDSERDELIRQFGQDPELLVRRATRAMWESRDKGHEALWGILMSYFSWIVPSGQEMASSVLGIPVEDLGSEASNIQARKTWLKAWTEQMKRLAMGKDLEVEETDESEEDEVPQKVKAAWELFLEESNKETDALERVVADGLDFAMSSSISGAWEETPEDILMRMEERGSDDFWKNPGRPTRHFYRKNGKQSVAVLPGEKPPVLYHVDLFGRREGTLRPNAPPVLVSPGVVYRSQKRVFPARQLLPSPFRMIAAMGLE